MPKLFFCSLFIPACELVRIYLSSYSIYINSKIMVGYRSVSSLYSPQWFWKSVYGCRWVDNNLSAIESESHPMKWVVPSVAYIASNSSELSLVDWMSTLSFHVISRLVKITNSRNMPFLLSSDNISVIINIHRSIMQSVFILLPLQNRCNNYNIVLFG
jgi:hypothetical protein